MGHTASCRPPIGLSPSDAPTVSHFGGLARGRIERDSEIVRLGLLAALLACLSLAATQGAGATSTPAGTRSCGSLNVGIGWHLRATRNVRCSFAMRLTTTYFARGDIRKPRVRVLHFVCRQRYVPQSREQIRCMRGTKLITATSNS
jgi:hypothetical protein